jgi:hypothetical protein
MTDRSALTHRRRPLSEILSGAQSDHLLKPGRGVLILYVHDGSCPDCSAYVEQISGHAAEVASWGCDVALIVAGESSYKTDQNVRTFNAAGELALTPGEVCPRVVIADQWGDVTLDVSSATHEFPPVQSLISEAQYLGTQCPECEGESL